MITGIQMDGYNSSYILISTYVKPSNPRYLCTFLYMTRHEKTLPLGEGIRLHSILCYDFFQSLSHRGRISILHTQRLPKI